MTNSPHAIKINTIVLLHGVFVHRGYFVTKTYGRVARWPWDMNNGFDIAKVSDLDMDTPLQST